MEMIDVLKKLEEIALTKPELVRDAVDNVTRTNPAAVQDNAVKTDEGGMSDVHIGAQEVIGQYADEDGNLKMPKMDVLRAMAAEKEKAAFPLSYEIEVAMGIVNEKFGNDGIAKADMDMNSEQPAVGEDTGQLTDQQIEQAKIWNKKYSQYTGKNGDDLPEGLIKANTDTGITSDGYEENEVKQYEKMFGKEEFDWDDEQHGEFQEKSKITGGMLRDLEKIVGVGNADEEEILAQIGEKVLGMNFGDTYKPMPADDGDDGRAQNAYKLAKDQGEVESKNLNTNTMKTEGKKQVNKSKKPVKEAIQISTDSPQEASMMMQLLKLAGVQQVDQDMINQEPEAPAHGEEGHVCGDSEDDAMGSQEMGRMRDIMTAPAEEKAEENFANSMGDEKEEPKIQDTDTLVNTMSGGMNRQKKTYPKVASGDNPMAVEDTITAESLANSLREQYDTFKETYTKVAEAKAKPDFLDMDKDGNKKEPMKKAIKDKEAK